MKDYLKEYTFHTSLLDEDDDDENVEEIEMEDEPEEEPENGDGESEGENPNMGDVEMLDTGGGQGMEVDSEMEGTPEIGAEDEMGDVEDIDMEDDVDIEQEGDEVIDVTDIVDGQEDSNEKINKMMKQFKKIYSKVDDITKNLGTIVSKTDKKIDNVKHEITSELEKRLPTNKEKLNIRTLSSGPFNVSVENYWDKKSKDDRYDIDADNKPNDDTEYVLTQDDIDNEVLNPQYISKTFNSNF